MMKQEVVLRGCIRCGGGAVKTDEDEYGRFRLCINCGWTVDLPPELRIDLTKMKKGVVLGRVRTESQKKRESRWKD
jgi:hypothetical protein